MSFEAGDEDGDGREAWQRPAFWEAEPSKAELDRRRCIELARVRRRLLFVEARYDDPPRKRAYDAAKRKELIKRLRQLEDALGMKRSRLGRGGPGGEAEAGWRAKSLHRDRKDGL